MAETPISEDTLLRQLWRLWPWPPRAGLGPGDDAAVVPFPPRHQLVLKTDAVVEGVHFLPADPPRWIGHKALARALSDFAAHGATPRHCLVTAGFPPAGIPRLLAAYRGMAALARRHGVLLAGGELTRSPVFWLNVTLTGTLPRGPLKTRAGARPGDVLVVTGLLGGSFPDRHLRFPPRLREGQWLARRPEVTALMDLSDGLGRDLPRLAAASRCSYQINPASLPRRRGTTPAQAANDGEDYELLFTVKPRACARLQKDWPFPLRLTPIGTLLPPGSPPDTSGLPLSGWDHLAR